MKKSTCTAEALQGTNPLWVSDFTYVSTWQGWLYVAFVIDMHAQCIVGWESAVRSIQASFWMLWSGRFMPGNPSSMAP